MLAHQSLADRIARVVTLHLAARDADVELLPEAEAPVPVGERRQPHALRKRVEVDVAAAADGSLHVQRAADLRAVRQELVLRPVDPAAPVRHVRAEEVPVALDFLVRGDGARTHRADVDDGLDDRARRIRRIDRAVHCGRARQALGSAHHLAGGDGRPRDHREDLAGVHFHHHRRAVEGSEVVKRHRLRIAVVLPAVVPLLRARQAHLGHEERLHARLQRDVERQLQVGTARGLGARRVAGVKALHDAPAFAAQEVLVGALDATTADHVAAGAVAAEVHLDVTRRAERAERAPLQVLAPHFLAHVAHQVVRDALHLERERRPAQRARHGTSVKVDARRSPRVDAPRAVLHLDDAGMRICQLSQRKSGLCGQLRGHHVRLALLGDGAHRELPLRVLAVLGALDLQARLPHGVRLLLDLRAHLAHARGELRGRQARGRGGFRDHRIELGLQRAMLRRDPLLAVGGAQLVPCGASGFLLRRGDRARTRPRAVDGGVEDGQVVARDALGKHAALAVGDGSAYGRKQRAAVEPALRQGALLASGDHREAEEPRGHRAHGRHEHDADDEHPSLEHRGAAQWGWAIRFRGQRSS